MLISFVLRKSKLTTLFQLHSSVGLDIIRPYCLDISDRRGGLLVYIKSNLPSRRLTNYTMPKDIQVISSELNLREEKWMFMGIYRTPAQNKQYFLENLSMIVDHYSGIYDNHIILGDFNIEPNSPILI